MRKPDPVIVPTQVKSAYSGGSQAPTDNDIHMVTERQRKSVCLWLPVDDESDSSQPDEEPLAGSRVRTTGSGERQHAAAKCSVSASRRSLIEVNEGR
jgi:hypothetical protein